MLAYACNPGYAGMADASGISEDTLAWTSQWYLRHDTLRKANARLVNAHHRHPLAALWGGGTLSSSDGQRFPQRGHSLTARALSRFFLDEGTTTYTHVSDQHSTYGTTVIPTTWREAVAVLDDIFGNPTDLPIAEHTTDTAGQTLATFAIFNVAGLQFSRIRDIGRLQLYRLGPGSSWRTRYPHAAALLTQPIQTQLIADHWNDLLRLVGSMKFGHTTASLLIAKRAGRQRGDGGAERHSGRHLLAQPVAGQRDRRARVRRDLRCPRGRMPRRDVQVAGPAEGGDGLLGHVRGQGLAVPAVFVLDLGHALGLDRLGQQHRRLVPVGAGLGESAVDVGQVVAVDDQRPAAEGVHAGGVALEVPLQFGGAALTQSV